MRSSITEVLAWPGFFRKKSLTVSGEAELRL